MIKAGIYIPIWLDLLLNPMIINIYLYFIFTFQYGQIYYELLNSASVVESSDLHSNMVRFIIDDNSIIQIAKSQFTFQYGQIYYLFLSLYDFNQSQIYIPIWLDLLYIFLISSLLSLSYLHSNMVRFIIIINSFNFIL